MPYAVRARTMLWRGVRRRCGRCGANGIFKSHFRLHERCPRCGYRFERETGFWMGVYLINYSFTAFVLVGMIVGYVIWVHGHPGGGSVWAVVIAGEAIAIVLPLLLYPFAKALWAAIDLAMRPLSPVEEAEAALHAS